MLTLENIALQQGDFALTADWSVQAPRKLAVIGPSGAGKSTLLDLIAGFRAPAKGRILWSETELTTLAPAERPISMLFQDQNLFPHLSIERNLSLALRPDGGRLSSLQKDQMSDALSRMGLSQFAARKPGALSGGQQARAALARVLLQARPILLLDEPFAALGPALKSEMLALVAEMATQSCALSLLVTHDPQDARDFAEETVLVADGIAHAPRATLDLFQNPPEALRAYLGD
ncbi:MAG: ATP-binding cassette domain-containing protein [Pelagimonas sp.]|nr:ATP-binding cassette domain-containing protein [Pelagimonas sp.]